MIESGDDGGGDAAEDYGSVGDTEYNRQARNTGQDGRQSAIIEALPLNLVVHMTGNYGTVLESIAASLIKHYSV